MAKTFGYQNPLTGETEELTAEEMLAKLSELTQKNAELTVAVEASKKAPGTAGRKPEWAAVAAADMAPEDSILGKLHRLDRETLTSAMGKTASKLDSAVLADFIHTHTGHIAAKASKSHDEVATAIMTKTSKPRAPKVAAEVVTEDTTEAAPELVTA
jgi:hypothetical protein